MRSQVRVRSAETSACFGGGSAGARGRQSAGKHARRRVVEGRARRNQR